MNLVPVSELIKSIYSKGCCRCKLTLGHRTKEGSLIFKNYIYSSSIQPARNITQPLFFYHDQHKFRSCYDTTIRLPTHAILSCTPHPRSFQTSVILRGTGEPNKPSSKVEETTEAIKKKAAEETEKKLESLASQKEAAVVVKKPLIQRVKDEILHYYHGFRLLFIDFRVSTMLVMKVLRGGTLTRREYNLLKRAVGDLFRLIPFSIFIIVPFMEFLLPVFIKFFPGMLPSTFQTAEAKDDKIKQGLKVKLEMAKFLQHTLDDMALTGKGHNSQDAKEFIEFFHKVRTEGGGMATNKEILKFSRLFEDEITLDSLTRSQLMALCRVLELQPFGTTNLLRFQLRMKLRRVAADDQTIKKEGVESLSQSELQQACRDRGMRALGMSQERLRAQLEQWLDLSLNEKVPPSLLLLSRAFMLPESITTTEKLVATISALPDTVATRTKAVIGEREGKVDNKTQIELMKEEVARIQEEKKEAEEAARIQEEKKEVVEAVRVQGEKKEAEEAARIQEEKKEVDEAVRVQGEKKEVEEAAKVVEELEEVIKDKAPILKDKAVDLSEKPEPKKEQELTAQDIGETLEDVLDTVGKGKKKMILEKEELDDLKEEMKDYQEDVQELDAATKLAKGTDQELEVKESKAAKRLSRTVNKMIAKMDIALSELEKREVAKKETLQKDESHLTSDELIRVDELIEAIHKLQTIPDASRMEKIIEVLGKIDNDKDGVVKVDDLLKVLEVIGRENIKLTQKQLDDVIELLKMEEAVSDKKDTKKEEPPEKKKEQLQAKTEEPNKKEPPPNK